MIRTRFVDSHTAGEPTRVILDGAPDLGGGDAARQLEVFRRDHDRFRSATVNEPRGSDVLVGALVVPPADPACHCGVIFFNNVGFLGMCGHGLIGLMVTLAHLGRIGPGAHRIETPVGPVTATLQPNGRVRIVNVPSRRAVRGVAIEVPGLGRVTGDVAWGGNWFYLVGQSPIPLERARAAELTVHAQRLRDAINAQGHPEVDHVELFGPAGAGGHARNFVLCPGGAYDRSPCGTGTSAKLACLAADGKLSPGERWVQEGLLGTSFTGSFEWVDRDQGTILPTIEGEAHVTTEGQLLLDERDPFCWGIR